MDGLGIFLLTESHNILTIILITMLLIEFFSLTVLSNYEDVICKNVVFSRKNASKMHFRTKKKSPITNSTGFLQIGPYVLKGINYKSKNKSNTG